MAPADSSDARAGSLDGRTAARDTTVASPGARAGSLDGHAAGPHTVARSLDAHAGPAGGAATSITFVAGSRVPTSDPVEPSCLYNG